MQLHHTLMSQYKHGEVSGTGSVSFESVANCVTPEIKIYGKCVQDGTPAPDAPVDIVANANQYKCHGKNFIPYPYLDKDVTKHGLTYTVNSDCSVRVVGTSTRYTYFALADAPYLGDKDIGGAGYAYSTNGIYTLSKNLHYVSTQKKVYIWFEEGTVVDEVFYPQVELGTVATAYEPYFNGGTVTAPELLSVGDISDEYYPLTGKVVRRCGKIDIPSGVITTYGTPDNQGISFVYRNNNDVMSGSQSLCSHFENVQQSWQIQNKGRYGIYGDSLSSSAKYFRPPNENITTVDTFNAWLDEQKAAGTPVILVYALAEPVIEYIDPIPFYSQRGTNVIEESSNSVSGTQIEVKYLTHS